MIHALHGNFGLPDDLAPMLKATGGEFRVWNLWEWLRENPVAASFDAIGAALVARSAPPRVLLGYSLGGRLALHTLTQYPDNWDAAVILSAHPGLRSDEERAARLAADRQWAARVLREPWPEVVAAWNEQPLFRDPCPAPLPAGEGIQQGRDGPAEEWRAEISRGFEVWSLGRQEDLRTEFAAVQTPLLWITGERDGKFTGLAAEAALLCRRGSHAVIPDAGHRVHLDQPEATARTVREFLMSQRFMKSRCGPRSVN